ncbi:MAG TPA: UDP-N-acetylmuramate dehydrogenase [Anaerolineaceae bacterium]|nr:UDP-N-acetylmuramate dehydrogenase [Anaerolineaceae bacterium]
MQKSTQQIFEILSNQFGNQLQMNVDLKNHSTARVGGKATWFMVAKNIQKLAEIAQFCWDNKVNFFLLGAGSNILFSDDGFDGLVLLNQAKGITINQRPECPTIAAESGANLGLVARKAALTGLSGLEWAATVPGTIGGAVYGNAGAHTGDISSNLLLAEILQQNKGKTVWKKDDFNFSYRSSSLKSKQESGIVLSATFECQYDDPQKIKERMNRFSDHRRQTQPPGASMGSMFKNPPGDYAGRLIEAAGLKGYKIGGVKVSEIHANFFVNDDKATATNIYELIQYVQNTVKTKFNTDLELEIEMIGFNQKANNNSHQSENAI